MNRAETTPTVPASLPGERRTDICADEVVANEQQRSIERHGERIGERIAKVRRAAMTHAP